MKLFISWSGEATRKLAGAFRELVRHTLHTDEIFLSDQGISKGKLWFDELKAALQESTFCVAITTPESLRAPWLLFEAGAVWRAHPDNYVSALCIGVDHDDIEKSPLAQFQNTPCSSEDVLKLVFQLHKFFGPRVGSDVVNEAFQRHWPAFEEEALAAQFAPAKSDVARRVEPLNTDAVFERLEDFETFLLEREQRLIKTLSDMRAEVAPGIVGQGDLATKNLGDLLHRLNLSAGPPKNGLAFDTVKPPTNGLIEALIARSDPAVFRRGSSDID